MYRIAINLLLFLCLNTVCGTGIDHLKYSAEQENRIGYLKIDQTHPINESTYLYVKYALEDYKSKGVCCILLHLDTPGGEIFSSMKIAQLLHQIDVEDHIPVIAFIDHWAISAGAMLAYASRFIAVTPSSSMGAAEPVMMKGDGQAESASEKINSALRAEFVNLASFYHRNPLIAEAMVDKDMLLVYRNGAVIRLEKEEQIHRKDHIITRLGKLLTLNSEEMIQYKVANVMIPLMPVTPISAEELKLGRWPASKTLLFQESYLSQIPNAMIISYQDWRVNFFTFLSHPLISSLLVMGFIVGIYLEISHPGFGVPGMLALTSLGLILLSSFAAEAFGMLEMLVLGMGLILLLVEIFVIPGFGFIGILGIILMLCALFALTLPSTNGIEFHWDLAQLNSVTLEFITRLGYFIVTLLISVIVIILFARCISPRFLKKSWLILQEDQEGYVAASFDHQMIGKIGTVLTELKPAGHVLIDGNQFQALSEAGFLEKNQKIEVIGGQGSHLIVRKK